jgi:hypothetical protein
VERPRGIGVTFVPIGSLGDAVGVTTWRTISAKIAAMATLICAI